MHCNSLYYIHQTIHVRVFILFYCYFYNLYLQTIFIISHVAHRPTTNFQTSANKSKPRRDSEDIQFDEEKQKAHRYWVDWGTTKANEILTEDLEVCMFYLSAFYFLRDTDSGVVNIDEHYTIYCIQYSV